MKRLCKVLTWRGDAGVAQRIIASLADENGYTSTNPEVGMWELHYEASPHMDSEAWHDIITYLHGFCQGVKAVLPHGVNFNYEVNHDPGAS